MDERDPIEHERINRRYYALSDFLRRLPSKHRLGELFDDAVKKIARRIVSDDSPNENDK